MHSKSVLFLRGNKISRWNASSMQPEIIETTRAFELNDLLTRL
jgi:hypothetical protein